jgi:hypothetical protein
LYSKWLAAIVEAPSAAAAPAKGWLQFARIRQEYRQRMENKRIYIPNRERG